MSFWFAFHCLLCLAWPWLGQSVENPEEFVNLLAGTFTDGNRFSTGNTLPLIGYPHGFNHFAPQTIDENPYSGSWWFKGNDHTLTWLRCTHQPSPWIGDWGYFAFSPQLGGVNRNPIHFWEPRGAIMKPYLFDATVAPHGMRMQLTPTMHGAILRVNFQEQNQRLERRVCMTSAEFYNEGSSPFPYVKGKATQVHHDRMLITNFALHIHIESPEASSVVHHSDMTCFEYSKDKTVVHLRMATSLISPEQALVNLHREVPHDRTFEDILHNAKDVWNKLFKRVDVVLEPDELTAYTARHLSVFYTGLYRSLTFPRRLDEETANGEIVHYSPYDPQGKVHPGPLVTDNGFWDTFRTVYPMLSLLYPDLLGPIVQGWLNAYVEGGWLPSWASPGYRNCMVGTFADVVIADAIVKGVKGFDLKVAMNALGKDSFEEPPLYAGNAVGKEGLKEYDTRGFVSVDRPQNGGDKISRTLDFGFADFSTAQAFKKLATLKEFQNEKSQLLSNAQKLMTRAERAPRAMFDSHVGLMVAKSSSGNSFPGFSDLEWGNGYTEGNAWHHSFPPYAIDTLISLYGSKEKFLAKLSQILTTVGDFRVGGYQQEIHEMTEARALGMGQYSHNNQPCHHILYLFALLGDRATTETKVRLVMDKAYGPDFYAGDEDNGEQGAWFVLSSLGLFVTTPGTTEYVLGSPLFQHVHITRVDGRTLDVFAKGTGPTTTRVAKVLVNGKTVAGAVVQDDLLQTDCVVTFVMQGYEHTVTDAPVAHLRVEPVPESTATTAAIAAEENSSTNNNSNGDVNKLKAELERSHAVEQELGRRVSYLLQKESEASSTLHCDYFQAQFFYVALMVLLLFLALTNYLQVWRFSSMNNMHSVFYKSKAETHQV